ncbi:MAG TPA: hypothetical protein VEF76_01815 [Patescibacteria group bacterium]|nr:hypothetical protein [Patescibacteria group bacterium]
MKRKSAAKSTARSSGPKKKAASAKAGKTSMKAKTTARNSKTRGEVLEDTGRRQSKARKDGGQFPRNANRGYADQRDRMEGRDREAGMAGRSHEYRHGRDGGYERDEDMSYGSGRNSRRGEMMEGGSERREPHYGRRDEEYYANERDVGRRNQRNDDDYEMEGRRSRRGAPRAQEGREMDDDYYSADRDDRGGRDDRFYDDGRGDDRGYGGVSRNAHGRSRKLKGGSPAGREYSQSRSDGGRRGGYRD